jgi:hypothetical protein
VSSVPDPSAVNINGNTNKCQDECSLAAAGDKIKGTINIIFTSTNVEAWTKRRILEILTSIAARKSYRLNPLLAILPQIFLDAVN